jgi:hypothetical protein
MSLKEQIDFCKKYFKLSHPYDIYEQLVQSKLYNTEDLKKLNDIRFKTKSVGDKYYILYIGMIYSKIKQL